MLTLHTLYSEMSVFICRTAAIFRVPGYYEKNLRSLEHIVRLNEQDFDKLDFFPCTIYPVGSSPN